MQNTEESPQPDSVQVWIAIKAWQPGTTKPLEGMAKIVVKKEPIKIDFNLDRELLFPTLNSTPYVNEGDNNKALVELRVTSNFQPLADQVLELETEAILPSGGHEGHPAFPASELGKFLWNGLSSNPITVITNSDGGVDNLKYVTGEFSVKMKFNVIHVSSKTEKSIERQISVYTLVELTGGSFGVKPIETDTQQKHPSPYWVVPGLDLSLDLIATEYNRLIPHGPLLTVTDASLQFSGRYEINGNWIHGSHTYHRIGLDVDLRSSDIVDDDFDDKNGNGFLDEGGKITRDYNEKGKLDLHRTKLTEIFKRRVPRPRFEPTKKDKNGNIIVFEHFHLYYWNE